MREIQVLKVSLGRVRMRIGNVIIIFGLCLIKGVKEIARYKEDTQILDKNQLEISQFLYIAAKRQAAAILVKQAKKKTPTPTIPVAIPTTATTQLELF